MKEPKITIGDVELSKAEAMTMRVAIGNFHLTLEDGLGYDTTGMNICSGYLSCITNIYKLMMASIKAQDF